MPEDENNSPTTVTPNNSTIEQITSFAATDPLDPWQVQGKYTLEKYPLIIKSCFKYLHVMSYYILFVFRLWAYLD